MTKEELYDKWVEAKETARKPFYEDLVEWYLDEQRIALDRVKEDLMKQIEAMDSGPQVVSCTSTRRIFDSYD